MSGFETQLKHFYSYSDFFKQLNFIYLIFIYLCIYKHSLFKITGISAYCGLLTQIGKVFAATGSSRTSAGTGGRSELLPLTGLANRPHIPFTKSYFYGRKKFQSVFFFLPCGGVSELLHSTYSSQALFLQQMKTCNIMAYLSWLSHKSLFFFY